MIAAGSRASRGRIVTPLRGVGEAGRVVRQHGARAPLRLVGGTRRAHTMPLDLAAGPSAVVSLTRKSRKENCRQQRDRVAALRGGYFGENRQTVDKRRRMKELSSTISTENRLKSYSLICRHFYTMAASKTTRRRPMPEFRAVTAACESGATRGLHRAFAGPARGRRAFRRPRRICAAARRGWRRRPAPDRSFAIGHS